jgi:H+/Cl- antiporter ClcA
LIIPVFLIGGSIGYEGPAVQIGAAFMLMYGRFFKITGPAQRGLILAGGGAGLAAAFGAPLTGIVFIIEELAKKYKGQISLYILACVMMSGLICESFLGHYIYIGHELPTIIIKSLSNENYPAIVFCGLIGGLFGGMFCLILTNGSKLITYIQPPFYLLVFILGLVVAFVNFFGGPHLAGSGQAEIRAIVAGGHMHFEYFPLKAIGLLATYFSGLPGGLFTPALSLGGALGNYIVTAFPELNAHLIILLCMASFLSGVTQAPITSFTIVMEATGQDALLPVLIAVSLIANAVATFIVKKPLYEELAAMLALKKNSIGLLSIK